MSETESTLAERIAGCIATGWRKGVDGQNEVAIYKTLNGAFFNTDKRICAVANAHVTAIGEAAAPLVEQGASDEEIGKAMREAAIQLVPAQNGEFQLTPDNAGKAMLTKIMPIDFEWYGKNRLANAPSEYEGGSQEPEMRTQRWRNDRWENNRYLDEESKMYMGALLLKLAEEIPAVKEYFADCLTDAEGEVRKALQEAAMLVTDRGWEMMALWVKDCLKN